MDRSNPWSDPAQSGAEAARQLVSEFDKRSHYPDQVQVNTALIDLLKIPPGERWLEVGCGTGVISRLIAGQAFGPNRPAQNELSPLRGSSLRGLSVGVDRSSAFLRAAKGEDDNADESLPIRYILSMAEQLPLLSGVFDGCLAARLLLHLPDPLSAVGEMARVVRRGGRVALMDWDFGTVAVDHSDRKLTQRLLDWRTNHRGGNNWSGRQLLGLAFEAGLQEPQIKPVVSIVRQAETSLTNSLFHAAQFAREDRAITTEEYKAWTSEIQQRLASGVFFASIVYFVVIAYSP